MGQTPEWIKENMSQEDFNNILGWWSYQAGEQKKAMAAAKTNSGAARERPKPRTMGDA
jgi:hypothetical protein